jgi:hypothetical protein
MVGAKSCHSTKGVATHQLKKPWRFIQRLKSGRNSGSRFARPDPATLVPQLLTVALGVRLAGG